MAHSEKTQRRSYYTKRPELLTQIGAAALSEDTSHNLGLKSQSMPASDGGYEPPKPRPIVAKISSWEVKESIVKKARAVRPQSIKFVDDFSQRTLAKRNNQIPEMLEARKRGKLAYFIVDRLVIRKKPPGPNGTQKKTPEFNTNADSNVTEGFNTTAGYSEDDGEVSFDKDP